MFWTGKHQLISSKIALDKLHGFTHAQTYGEMTYLKRSSNFGLKNYIPYTQRIFLAGVMSIIISYFLVLNNDGIFEH